MPRMMQTIHLRCPSVCDSRSLPAPARSLPNNHSTSSAALDSLRPGARPGRRHSPPLDAVQALRAPTVGTRSVLPIAVCVEPKGAQGRERRGVRRAPHTRRFL